MSATTVQAAVELLPPQVPSLPRWPATPVAVDPTGASFLVLAVGGGPAAIEVARSWAGQAQAIGPTALTLLETIDGEDDRASLHCLLDQARAGVRVMVVGGQYDVLQTLSMLRRAGALEDELASFVTDGSEIPVFCAHCQTTFRARAAPNSQTSCPGCDRTLVVHEHLAVHRGSFLASDAQETTP